MSLWKGRARGYTVKGSMEVERYVYTPGISGLEASGMLRRGIIPGMDCGGTRYVPPKTYCPDHSPGRVIPVESQWRIISYTIIYRDFYGKPLKKPVIIGLVRPDGYSGGLLAPIKGDPGVKLVGLKVKPRFKPEESRKGAFTDIEFFEVEGEDP